MVTTVEAINVVRNGTDIVVVQGEEAGAYRSTFDINPDEEEIPLFKGIENMNITSKECYHQLAPDLKIYRIINGMWQVAGGYIDHELAIEDIDEVIHYMMKGEQQNSAILTGSSRFYIINTIHN
jgi:hypothetical protein